MLRGLVLLLLLLNAAYFAWSQGYLLAYGAGPADGSDPHRLAQQIRPDDIHLVSPEDAQQIERQPAVVTVGSAPAPAPAKTCWLVGVFDDAQAKILKVALANKLPADSWLFEPALQAARWIIYMGKYDSQEAVAKKRGELRFLNVPTDALRNPSLEPGLSLGGYDTQAAASTAMNALTQRGVRTARVVQERVELRGVQLRVPQADEALRVSLDSLKPQLAGKLLQRCSP